MKSKKIRKTLETALSKGTALKIKRRLSDFNEYGYPVSLAEYWVLFHTIQPDVMTLNGYMAVRIEELEQARPDTGFLMRALAALGEKPLPQPGIILTDLPSLLQSANEKFPLINLHFEVRYPGACYIGRVMRIEKKRLHLWDITPEAHWRKTTRQFPVKDITLVEFGDGYLNALWMLGQQEWLARTESPQDGRNSS